VAGVYPIRGHYCARGVLGVNINSEHKLRRAILPVAEIAKVHNLAVVFIRHLTKSAMHAIHAGSGSIAMTAIARSVLLAGVNPVDPDLSVLTVSKSNVAASQSISYTLESTNSTTAMQVAWGGRVDVTANDVIRKMTSEAISQLQEAEDFLFGALEEGPQPSKLLLDQAARAGIAIGTLRRAKKSLGVRSKKQGVGTSQFFIWSVSKNSDRLKAVRRRSLDVLCDDLFHGDESSGPAPIEPCPPADRFDNTDDDFGNPKPPKDDEDASDGNAF
jgi:hypothetical protein